jgi:SAM-dependent methyltransferase
VNDSRAGGYVTDVPYIRDFIRELAPAWLDHVAVVGRFAPPDRQDSFTWCDLGCGNGITAVALAATHPSGVFRGIDAMPVHTGFARRLAAEACISNVGFDAVDFGAAAEAEYPGFDYIVSHGVYTWVGEGARRSWLRFIDRHLKPGGLVYVSYNAMPGRAADLPWQRLVRTLGLTLAGSSRDRVAGALDVARKLTALKAPALVASPLAASFHDKPDRFSTTYLTHELMNADWAPLCVTEMRAAMADIGLEPAGSATLIENHDSFVLRGAAREVLAAIADPNARELVRDYFIDQCFRRDVFIRDGRRLSREDRKDRLMQSVFFLARGEESLEYRLQTPAGKLRFDNRTARHIVRALAGGPRRLADIADTEIPEQDLIANILVLTAASAVWPVNPVGLSVDALNAAILNREGGEQEIRWRVLPFGTAVPVGGEQTGPQKG